MFLKNQTKNRFFELKIPHIKPQKSFKPTLVGYLTAISGYALWIYLYPNKEL
jgi:hypothetical protein